MERVKFLKDIMGKDFSFKKGQVYTIEGEDSDYIYIRQPNSPKDNNWVSRMLKAEEGNLFEYEI